MKTKEELNALKEVRELSEMSIEKVTKEELLETLGVEALNDDALETVAGGTSDWALKCIRDADELYLSGAIDHAEWYSRQMSCRSIG